MSKRPGVMSLLASAGVATALVIVVGYAVAPGPDEATLTRSNAAPASPTRAATTQLPVFGRAPALTLAPKPSPTKTKTPEPKPTKTASPTPAPTFEFQLSSFNVLGASHTTSGGNKGSMASGEVRARYAAELLSRHGVDVVGFQELQPTQLHVLQQATGGRYTVYPGTSLGWRGTENSIAWRNDLWELVSARTIGIPYFEGRIRPMPYVELRNRATGLTATFANFHNPASTQRFPNQQRYRDRATALEVALANRLVAETGGPVFVTGDMNEREEYFCRMTGGAPMQAALGGDHDGGCHPPPRMGVDWIFGSTDVTFSNYIDDRGALVSRTTDHPMIVSTARIGGE